MVIVNKLYMLRVLVVQQQQQKKALFVEALSQQKNLQILDLKG